MARDDSDYSIRIESFYFNAHHSSLIVCYEYPHIMNVWIFRWELSPAQINGYYSPQQNRIGRLIVVTHARIYFNFFFTIIS